MNQPNATPKVKSARINDYTKYDSSRCNNGGAYGFWTDYKFIGDGNYEVTYGTTAGFEFCCYCNSFSCCCDKTPMIVTEEDVLVAIRDAEKEQSPEYYSEVKFFETNDFNEWIERLRRRTRDALNKTANEMKLIHCATTLDVQL